MDLVRFSESHGRAAAENVARPEQKELGQFLTPAGIARHMAKRCVSGIDLDSVRILDPAAGAGILVAAVVEELLSRSVPPSYIQVTMFELDDRLIPRLQALARRMRDVAGCIGVAVSVSIKNEDFLLSPMAVEQKPVADLIIANPPYFKIRSDDERAEAHRYAVFGQPNIYGLFMASCAALTESGGSWCFITPRSWTNGTYFSAVRRHLLSSLSIDAIHYFSSREDHFNADDIQQEAMITWAVPRALQANKVTLSESVGVGDIGESKLRSLPIASVIETDDLRKISLPVGSRNHVELLMQCQLALDSYGFKVSTGPVVPFRAERHIRMNSGTDTVPLLWMQHVKSMQISWPIQKKREHINASSACEWMLVRNEPMVILRRFCPKEGLRHIIAAPYLGDLPGGFLGLENHLNYIYRQGGSLTVDEANGLAAYMSSSLVDLYFRAISGSTQVNAADLRRLPVPSQDALICIGKECRAGMSLETVDSIVNRHIDGVAHVRVARA